MNFLNQFTIRSRLYASAGILTLLLLVQTVMSVSEARETRQELQDLVGSVLRKQELVSEIEIATRSNARNTLELFVVSHEQRKVVRERMAKTKTAIDGYFKELDERVVHPQARALLEEARARRKTYVEAFTDASKVLDDDQAEATYILNKRVLPAIDALSEPLSALMKFQKDLVHEREQAVMINLDQQIRATVALGALAVLMSVLTAWSLMQSINRPLADARQFAATLGTGDLTAQMAIEGHNELTELLEALDHMKERFAHVLMRIQQSAVSVASASSQIAAANIDLSSRTEEQASALEQTAATMEELISTVRSNAAATDTAHTLAERANRSASEVGTLVRSVVQTMQGIHGSSERIRDIVSVIDSIAFQTNILALNAAVEAARAGEQGRGFAVVASEVRALAQRSAAAAQEIKGIIEDNVARMEAGNAEAGRAGEAVDEALRNIGQVNQSIAEVDHASKEQSAGIEQVGHAVQQMEQVTQQNAALVEETSAATKNLDDQVQNLKDQISRFRIHHTS